MSDKITVRIDDKEVQTDPGVNVIDLAKDQGIEIPHYCYHPALPVAGNCRMCFVEIEGMPHPQIACNTPLRDGMVIKTRSDMAVTSRKWTLEFLLANHPLDCPVCDKAGECDLQNYSYRYGKIHTDFVERKRTPETVPLSDKLVIEKDRCIVCLRCVQFLREVGGKEELYVHQRGNASEIVIAPGKPVESEYQLNTADICPVGALSPTNFRFAERVWNLETHDSICPLCPRGCNIKIDMKDNEVHRAVPRFNKEINSYWMCDEGRYYFDKHHKNRTRIEEFLLKGETIDSAAAFIHLVENTKALSTKKTLLNLSNWLCNEDIKEIADFADKHLNEVTFTGPAFKEGGDSILRRWDHGPNAKGLRDTLGSRFVERDQLTSSYGLCISFGEAPLPGVESEFFAFYGGYEEEFLSSVPLTLPGIVHGEIEGTYSNFEGVAQSFTAFLEAPEKTLSIQEFLERFSTLLEQK